MLYFTGSTADYTGIGLMTGETLESLELVDGGYNRDRIQAKGGIELGSAPIILADTGECIGFDLATKSLYFQRADGSRIVIAK